MKTKSEFWNLNDDAIKIESPAELFEILQKNSHVTNAFFIPDELHKSGDPKNYRINGKTFKRVSFSKTHISGFVFTDCIFDHCLFIGTKIEDCEFHNCKFIQTNTHKISISNTYINPTSFRKCLIRRKHQNIGVHLYQILRRNSRETNQTEFERSAHFQFLRWKRFQDFYEIKKSWKDRKATELDSGRFMLKCLGILFRLIWEKLFGSGLRIRNFVLTVSVVITIFTVLNYSFREKFGLVQDIEKEASWMEAIYYTIISFTTVGYGDIVPSTPIGQLVASVQSLFGFFLLAVLASMLFRKFSP